jgi:hypothetical protein
MIILRFLSFWSRPLNQRPIVAMFNTSSWLFIFRGQILSHWIGDIADSGIELSFWYVRLLAVSIFITILQNKNSIIISPVLWKRLKDKILVFSFYDHPSIFGSFFLIQNPVRDTIVAIFNTPRWLIIFRSKILSHWLDIAELRHEIDVLARQAT